MSDLDTTMKLVNERDKLREAVDGLVKEKSDLAARLARTQDSLTQHEQRAGDLESARSSVRKLKEHLDVSERDLEAERRVRESLEREVGKLRGLVPQARDEFKAIADSAEQRMTQIAEAHEELLGECNDLQREVDRLRKIEAAAIEDLRTRDSLRSALER